MAETAKKRFILMAKMAKVRRNYNTMILHMNDAVKTRVAFDDEERRLLVDAYSIFLASKRSALKLVLPMAKYINPENTRLVTEICKRKIKSDEISAYKNMLELLNRYLIPNATDNESKIFYFKVKADYHKYFSEVSLGEKRINEATNSFRAYKHAARLAQITIPVTHPLRLAVALNISKYYCDIEKSAKKAYTAARQAYNEAEIEIDNMLEEHTIEGIYNLTQLGQYILFLQEEMENQKDEDEDEDDDEEEEEEEEQEEEEEEEEEEDGKDEDQEQNRSTENKKNDEGKNQPEREKEPKNQQKLQEKPDEQNKGGKAEKQLKGILKKSLSDNDKAEEENKPVEERQKKKVTFAMDYEKEPEEGRKPVKRKQQKRVTFTTDDEEEKQLEKKLRKTK